VCSSDLIEETDENLGRYTNQMDKWAKYIEKAIGSKKAHRVKAVSQVINGCTASLPDDCYLVLGVFPGNYEDECNLQYRNISNIQIRTDDYRAGEDVYDRDLTMLWLPLDTTWLQPLAWEEIGNELHLISTYEDYDVTIVYSQIELDDKGFWLVNESHIPAITAYIKFMYARKFQWNVFKSEKMLREGHMAMIRGLERDYNIAVRNARAEDGRENEFERQIL
jgi:hypothetical protein